MTKRLTTRSTLVAQHIRDLIPFNTHTPNFRAVAVEGEAPVLDPPSKWVKHRLSQAEWERYDACDKWIDYIVYSYDTPIAWHTPKAGWHIVDQKFSPTTTKHQSNLYLVAQQRTGVRA